MRYAPFTAVLACAAVASVALAAFVWSRRRGGAGRALVVMLLGVAIWNAAYAGELLAEAREWMQVWGDLKYLGINTLAPAWLLFVLFWTGREHLVSRRLVALLMLEPLVVLILLAMPSTHDLIRTVVATSRTDAPGPLVDAGPLFWAHLVYVNATMLVPLVFFVSHLLHKSEIYRKQAVVLVAAALLPWVANLGFNLRIGVLALVDLTPPAFVLSGLVLAWGLLHQRLLHLAPVADRRVVAGLRDAVLVMDVFGNLVQTNHAAQAVLSADSVPEGLAGRALPPEVTARLGPGEVVSVPVTLQVAGAAREYELTSSDLPDRRGNPGGRLIVMRDVTVIRARERQLQALLAQRDRVATTLSRSLRPGALPEVDGVSLAAAYRPAGAGREIGGDFYDVYPAGPDRWTFAIGDVSGKGASAAAVTALARYSLRAFGSQGRSPARTLAMLNRHILSTQAMDETYLTVAYGTFSVDRASDAGPDGHCVAVSFTLGGHPPPLLVRATGEMTAVGTLGAAVGLFPELTTRNCDVRLEPGDSLVFHTDGVTEARRGRSFFGEDGLMACIAELLHVTRRTGGEPPNVAGSQHDAAAPGAKAPWATAAPPPPGAEGEAAEVAASQRQDGGSNEQDGESAGQDGWAAGQDGWAAGQDGESAGQDGWAAGQDAWAAGWPGGRPGAEVLASGILAAVLDFQEGDAADDIAVLVIQAAASPAAPTPQARADDGAEHDVLVEMSAAAVPPTDAAAAAAR